MMAAEKRQSVGGRYGNIVDQLLLPWMVVNAETDDTSALLLTKVCPATNVQIVENKGKLELNMGIYGMRLI